MDNGNHTYSTEAVVAVVSLVLGWIFRVVASAFTIGKRLDTFATKDDVAKQYVTKETFNEFKTDIKEDIRGLREDISETRTEILRAIQGGK